MRSASAPLIAYLNGRQKVLVADLYTLTLANGTVARYALADDDVTIGGNTFSAKTILLSRGKIKSVIGVQVDTLDLTVDAKPSHTLNGTPWLQACRQGALDGAALKLERLFMQAPGDTTLGTIILFTGRIAETEIGRSQVKITVKSDLELLNITVPRNLYQPGCINTLFDGGCTLTKASFGVASSVAAGSTPASINCGLSNATGYFSLGTITFTSGALSGVSASVKSYVPGVLSLLGPLIGTPAAGDTFTAYPGCDKSQATCTSKFSNLAHFRGFPYVPAPSTIL